MVGGQMPIMGSGKNREIHCGRGGAALGRKQEEGSGAGGLVRSCGALIFKAIAWEPQKLLEGL